MTASTELTVSPRTVIGKASRRLNASNAIPAVLYGTGRDPLSLSIDRHEFELFLAHNVAGSTVVELKLEGEKKAVNAMIREVQHSPVKGTVVHIDFLAVEMDKLIHAVVAVHLINDPEGVKSGGVLTTSAHELNVEAKPGDLPDAIEVDVSALEMGDSLHLSDIIVPAGVTLLDDPETIIASVQAPRGPEAEEAELEAAEPEVIGATDEGEE